MKSKSVQLRDAASGVADTLSKRAATPTRMSRRTQLLKPPIRLLTAVPICDGHDSAINTINLEFIHCGLEVVYLGYHRSARDIVRAATQEDVRAIGLSSYNGGHVEFFTEVVGLPRQVIAMKGLTFAARRRKEAGRSPLALPAPAERAKRL